MPAKHLIALIALILAITLAIGTAPSNAAPRPTTTPRPTLMIGTPSPNTGNSAGRSGRSRQPVTRVTRQPCLQTRYDHPNACRR